MRARNVLFVLVIGGFLLLAVACATPLPSPTTPAPTQTPEPTKAPTPIPFVPPTDPIGVIKIAPTEPIQIAWMLVTTGAEASFGVDSRRGIEIALEDRGGKLLDRAIKLSGQDSGCTAEGGQAAATKLVADATIVAVVGSSCSDEMRAGGSILSKAGLTMISPSNTASEFTEPGKRVVGYFRTAPSESAQGRVAAQFLLTKLNLKSAAIIFDGSPYAMGVAGNFADGFEKGGGKIVARETVKAQDRDFKPVLTKIAASKPDLIFYPLFPPAAAPLTMQVKDVPGLEKVVLMTAENTFSPNFLKSVGKPAIGLFQTAGNLTSITSSSDYKEFLDKYQKKYNEKPVSVYHAHAYDATNILFAAIEKVAVKAPDGTLYIARQALRDAVAATTNFKGVTGTVTCDPNGDCAAPAFVVFQVSEENINAGQMPSKPFWMSGTP